MLRPIVCIAMLALAGCAEDPPVEEEQFRDLVAPPPPDLGVIVGVVVDDRIAPVAGVAVNAQGPSRLNTTTDEAGRFAFADVIPGTYFLSVDSPLHEAAQTSFEVKAGVAKPEPVKLLVQRLYEQEPYIVQIKEQGYFQCSQAGGGYYSSSNCVTDPYRRVFGPGESPTGEADNATQQDREWHMNVAPGWKSLVFEMEWEPSSNGTSEWLGMVVSTYKPERDGTHSFANQGGPRPFLLRLEEGEQHPTGANVEPIMIPERGMNNVSFFVSVRQDNPPEPAYAVEQEFEVFVHQFYYLAAPEDWSFVAGDPLPY